MGVIAFVTPAKAGDTGLNPPDNILDCIAIDSLGAGNRPPEACDGDITSQWISAVHGLGTTTWFEVHLRAPGYVQAAKLFQPATVIIDNMIIYTWSGPTSSWLKVGGPFIARGAGGTLWDNYSLATSFSDRILFA